METRRRLAALAGPAVLATALAGCSSTADEPPGDGSLPSGSTGDTSAPSSTAMPPWPAPVVDVPERVAAAGLDLGPMGTAEHYHPRLSVVVDGEPVVVPPDIGVDRRTGAMSAVHTHTPDGTIHVEADTVDQVFTLGQLFTQWGVALDAERVGGAAAREAVELTVDGEPVDGDPADLRLQPDQEIVVEVSTTEG